MHEIEWPDGIKRKASGETLKTWLHHYRAEGIDGLVSKSRLDVGCVRKHNDHHKEFIHHLMKEFPK